MYQSLSLESKIAMTKLRIEAWRESWTRFEIYDEKTGKTRFSTCDMRDYGEPELRETERVVMSWPGAVYVSFSGGKDSTVLKHIVDSMYDDVPALFVNTGLEYPEIQRFAKDVKAGKWDCFNSDVEIVRPEMRFDEVIVEYGYPLVSKEVAQIVREARIGLERGDGSYLFRIQKLRGEYKDKDGNLSSFNKEKWGFLLEAPFSISEQCCMVMKKNPAKAYEKETGRVPILGVIAQESSLRKQWWERYGCNAFDASRPVSNPMAFWTEQDVLQYIKKYDVPYCSVYGDIVSVDGNGGQYDIPNDFYKELESVGQLPRLATTGAERTGCIFCMFGCHLEKGENRFQRLKKTHPHQYNYCINGGEMVDGKLKPTKDGLGLGKVLDYIGVKYD